MASKFLPKGTKKVKTEQFDAGHVKKKNLEEQRRKRQQELEE